MDSFISDLLNRTPEGRRELVRAKLRVKASLQLELRMEALDLSQADLAQRLGVSRSAVSQALSGDRNFSLNTLADMAQALGLDVHLELQPPGQSTAHRATSTRTSAATQLAGAVLARATGTDYRSTTLPAATFINVQTLAPSATPPEAAP